MEPPVVTVTAPDGARLAEVSVRGGVVRVVPPEAAAHPLVAAVAGQMRRTALRSRRRASC